MTRGTTAVAETTMQSSGNPKGSLTGEVADRPQPRGASARVATLPAAPPVGIRLRWQLEPVSACGHYLAARPFPIDFSEV